MGEEKLKKIVDKSAVLQPQLPWKNETFCLGRSKGYTEMVGMENLSVVWLAFGMEELEDTAYGFGNMQVLLTNTNERENFT